MRAPKRVDKWRKMTKRWANNTKQWRGGWEFITDFKNIGFYSLLTLVFGAGLFIGCVLSAFQIPWKSRAPIEPTNQFTHYQPLHHALYVDGDDDHSYMEYNFNIKEILNDVGIGDFDNMSSNSASFHYEGTDWNAPNIRDLGSFNQTALRAQYPFTGVDRILDLANRYTNFDNDFWYGNTEETPKWPLTQAQKRQIVAAINESMYHLIHRVPIFDKDDFVVTEAYWRHRTGQGIQYILDFQLKVIEGLILKNKTQHEINKRVIYDKKYNGVGVKQPDTLTIKDLDQREDHVTVIVPLSDIGSLIKYASNKTLNENSDPGDGEDANNEGRKLDDLVGRLAKMCDTGISLMVSYCGKLEYEETNGKNMNDRSHYGRSSRRSKVKKFKVSKDEVSQAIAAILRRHTETCQGLEIQLVSVDSNNFVKAKALSGGISAIKDEDLILITSLEAHWGQAFLRRCRHNTVYGKVVYLPIPYKLYNPYMVDQFSESSDDYGADNGLWLENDYATACMYKDDYTSVHGYNSTLKVWGQEDVDLFKKFMLSDIKVFRSTDNDLVFDYFDPSCLKSVETRSSINGFLKCMGRVRSNFASKSQMSRRLFAEMYSKGV